MKTCRYVSNHKNIDHCKEEAINNSDYCILHTDFPEDTNSPNFNALIDEKNKKVEQKIKNKDYNFCGAKLFEINFSRREIESDVNFTDAHIRKDVIFDYTRINGIINFNGAKIDGSINFEEARIDKDVKFKNTFIKRDADFTRAAIGGIVDFENAKILKKANFPMAIIDESINFEKAKIGEEAYFNRAILNKNVNFFLATINGNLNFLLTPIGGDVNFSLASIGGNVDFRAKIDGKLDFEKSVIDGDANFEELELKKNAYFLRSVINGNANFRLAKIDGDLDFSGSKINRNAVFEEMKVNGGARFEGVEIGGNVNFKEAKVNRNTNFEWAKVDGYVHFLNTEFNGFANFNEASFLSKGIFEKLNKFKASFEGAMLRNIIFLGCDLTNTRFKNVIFERCGLSTSHWEDNMIKEHHDYRKNKIKYTNKTFFILSDFLKILWIPELIEEAESVSDTYRRIKKCLNEEGTYNKAGYFYKKEMDVKREVYWNNNKSMWLFYTILSITTSYGESIRRLVFCYFGIILIFAALYALLGFSINDAIIYSALNSISLIYNPSQANGLEPVIFIERLIGTVFITLFVYIFARKMSR